MLFIIGEDIDYVSGGEGTSEEKIILTHLRVRSKDPDGWDLLSVVSCASGDGIPVWMQYLGPELDQVRVVFEFSKASDLYNEDVSVTLPVTEEECSIEHVRFVVGDDNIVILHPKCPREWIDAEVTVHSDDGTLVVRVIFKNRH